MKKNISKAAIPFAPTMSTDRSQFGSIKMIPPSTWIAWNKPFERLALTKGFEDVWEVVARMEQQKDLEPFNMEYMGDKYHTIKDAVCFQSKHVFFLINLSLSGLWSLFIRLLSTEGRP